jgi:hypothetical protein
MWRGQPRRGLPTPSRDRRAAVYFVGASECSILDLFQSIHLCYFSVLFACLKVTRSDFQRTHVATWLQFSQWVKCHRFCLYFLQIFLIKCLILSGIFVVTIFALIYAFSRLHEKWFCSYLRMVPHGGFIERSQFTPQPYDRLAKSKAYSFWACIQVTTLSPRISVNHPPSCGSNWNSSCNTTAVHRVPAERHESCVSDCSSMKSSCRGSLLKQLIAAMR